MTDFDTLIAELAPLVKALPAGGEDARIRGAATEAGADIPGEDEGGEGGEGGEAGAGEGDGDDISQGGGDGNQDDTGDTRLGKSVAVTLPDGSVGEAFDASVMLKSLDTQIGNLKAEVAALRAVNEAAGNELAKSFAVAGTLTQLVTRQGAMLKSLRADFDRVAAAPVGRKVVLNLHEKVNGTAPASPAPATSDDVMAKAMTAMTDGKLTAADICRLEAYRNRGLAPPPEILAAIA